MAKEKPTVTPVDDDIEIKDDAIIIEPEAGAGDDGVDDGAASLKEQLAAAQKRGDDEAAKRVAAERLADERGAEVERIKPELDNSNVQVIANAISAAEKDERDLETKLNAAYEAGDFKTVSKLTIEGNKIAVKLQRLNEGKNQLENRISDEAERAKSTPADPVEAYAATLTDARSRDWVRAHPEVVTDQRKSVKVVAAHWAALDEGLTAGTQEYFDHLEQKMGYASRTENEPIPRRQTPPAAPPSRDGGTPPASGSRFRLTAQQRDAAEFSGITYKEYYDNMTPEQQASARVN